MDVYEHKINNTFFNILKGICISIVCTLIFLFVFSALLVYTDLSENVIIPVILVITAISIFIGSSIGNLKMKKNGLLNGGIIGGIYVLLIYVLSSIINGNFELGFMSVIMILVGIVCGILGGVIGINIVKS